MNPHRTQHIRQAILKALSHAGGYALPEATLRPHVDGLLRPPIQDKEWSENIQWLEDGKRIIRVKSVIDETLVQFALTEHGQTLLATL